MPTHEFNQIYLKIFCIHVSHFDFDVPLKDQVVTAITTNALKNVLVTFLSKITVKLVLSNHIKQNIFLAFQTGCCLLLHEVVQKANA